MRLLRRNLKNCLKVTAFSRNDWQFLQACSSGKAFESNSTGLYYSNYVPYYRGFAESLQLFSGTENEVILGTKNWGPLLHAINSGSI